ncbi:hypothetical protein [Streptomyces sp. H27-D2]|uniref:hypothetical protein n=1 Tax=Streptomyces sp. H27-D2 TaxID=3046304 RepID=UPI002DB55D3D|nr:hypothetical protein [Streptomyces sp. H27-D2]MEC4019606.1 hypothetical protein [Streptomyces sp. H27-D2]
MARLLAPANALILRDMGAREEDIQRFTDAFLTSLPEWTEDSFPGTLSNVVSGRIANCQSPGNQGQHPAGGIRGVHPAGLPVVADTDPIWA